MRVTAKKLVDAGAGLNCDVLQWFKRRWPNGCDTTLKNLEAAAEKDVYLLTWFTEDYLRDPKFSTEIEIKQIELVDAWDDTVGKRYIESAKECGRRFITYGRQVQRQAIKTLRVLKRNYKSSRANEHVLIAHKLARMVYDKIKSGAGKKRRAK